jgi:hypothetical protein
MKLLSIIGIISFKPLTQKLTNLLLIIWGKAENIALTHSTTIV